MRQYIRNPLPFVVIVAVTSCFLAPMVCAQDTEDDVPVPQREDGGVDREDYGGNPDHPAETPREAYELGIAFLIESQQPNGSWGSFVSSRPNEVYLDNLSSHRAFRGATTALAVMALIEPSRTNELAKQALDKGLNFLLTAEQPGRASGSTFYNTWAHTYMLQALSRVHQDDRFAEQREQIATIARRELKTLNELQSAAGGWGYYDFGAELERPTGDQSTSFNTAAAVLAYDEAKEAGFDVDDTVITTALGCIERMRMPGGSYIYGFDSRYAQTAGFNQVKGSLGRSQPCNLVLYQHDRDVTQADLIQGLDNLKELHHFIEIGRGRPVPHEAWYSTAGYYYFFGHYYASRVIQKVEGPKQREHAEWLANVMLTRQDPDGSWFDFPFYGYSKEYGCAYAVLTLQNCLDVLEETDTKPAEDE